MPDKLKTMFFTDVSLKTFAGLIKNHHPEFNTLEFLQLVQDQNWKNRELKDKMRHTTHCLKKTLPHSYPEALKILKLVAPDLKGFEAMTLPDFVEVYGQDSWELSLETLRFFTMFASSEFAIRPFLDRKPEAGMTFMLSCANDPNKNIRRFASEGCRPRLPWAMALPKFKKDPSLIIPVLEALKDDPSEFVRRSVANNINDISKDHPDKALDLCEGWKAYSENTDKIIKHACRTMLKSGHKRALQLFNYGNPQRYKIENTHSTELVIKIGASIQFQFDILNLSSEPQKTRLEYAIDFVKKSGRSTRKVFMISEFDLAPGKRSITRRHSFANLSTRIHYPGKHRLSILVNGVEKESFMLDLES